LGSIRPALQWAAAVGASLILALVLDRFALPASFLVGPMMIGILCALGGATIRLPRSAFIAGQALIGCLIARVITASLLTSILQSWPFMAAAILGTVAASTLVGWLLVRFGSLPGSTAAWGTSAGAASAMVAMSQEFGADPLLVAMMQYLRVIFVVLTASLVAGLWLGPEHPVSGAVATTSSRAGEANILSLIETLAVTAAGAWLGLRLKIPAGGLLVPMTVAALLQGTGYLTVTLPKELLLLGYGAIGLSIGLRFSRDLLRRTVRVLPEMLAATFALIGLCGVSAWTLVHLLHIDALTAYLATSPGGLDSVAIIAAGSNADVPFVLALQTLRLLVVVLTGPFIAKLLSTVANRGGGR
jgi:membrane AbrB-like protein